MIQIDDTTHVSQSYNERVRFLVLHYTALDTEASIRALTAPNNVSAHYLVSDKNPQLIYRLVSEDKRAWHAGVSKWQGRENLNDSSIGIEIINLGYTNPNKQDLQKVTWYPFPDEQIDAVIELTKDIVTRYKIDPTCVIGHADIATGRKKDPGPLFPWERLYENGVGAWADANKVQEKIAAHTVLDDIATIQNKLARYGYQQNVTGQYDEATKGTVCAFQMHFRPSKFDGKWDIETQATLDTLLEKYAASLPKYTPIIPAAAPEKKVICNEPLTDLIDDLAATIANGVDSLIAAIGQFFPLEGAANVLSHLTNSSPLAPSLPMVVLPQS
ncbi:MAG: N-acetylmuramoyl-L-alanine amidase [Ottowia sp.]|nr:N-acetylmuramoyl-L-alanine amidase [Ottowia sp.]